MLVARRIGMGQVPYYLGGPPGRWTGRGALELSLSGTVEESALRAALGGRSAKGKPLLRRIPVNRRAGFDLIFAAPKSVSLLAALAPRNAGGRIVQAHERAVTDAVHYLERWAVRTRRRAALTNGEGRAGGGLVAAAFVHHHSWSGDPHLHTHLVVANLSRAEDGIWSCLESRSLYRHGRAAGTIYQCSLRHQLSELGFGLSWVVRPDGLGDVVGVPRAVIDACSRRRRQILADAGAQSSARARTAAAGRTRRNPRLADRSWKARSAAAGFASDAASDLLIAKERPNAAIPPSARQIEAAVAREGSTFEWQDVVRVVASLAIEGAPLSVVERQAGKFLSHALQVDCYRWTTLAEERHAEAIVRTAQARREDRAGMSSAGLSANCRPLSVSPTATDDAQTDPKSDEHTGSAVRRLTRSGAGVEILSGPGVVAQATVLDEARSAWIAGGHRVALVTADHRALARWQALTGLEPPPPAPAKPTVVIIDRADRLLTTQLQEHLADAGARRAKVILIDGGAAPASLAFARLKECLDPINPGRAPAITRSPPQLAQGGRDATVNVALSGTEVLAGMVADWYQARDGPDRPTMVALGPAEANHLNQLARARRAEMGELQGPTIHGGGGDYQAGDEVRALRRDPRLGQVAAGAVGTVVGVDVERRQLTIQWPTIAVTVPSSVLSGRGPLTHAYATTLAYALRAGAGTTLGLGDVKGVNAVYAVAPAPAPPLPRRPQLQDINSDRRPHVLADETGRSLRDLALEHRQLRDRLRSMAPPDTGPPLRQLEEQRVWLDSRRPTPDRDARLAELQRRRAELLSAQQERNVWLDHHREERARLANLTATMSWRQHALGKAAELRPTRAVEAALGPRPDAPHARERWREAARAIESHRDRARLPDGPLSLSRDGADDLRVLAAIRTAERAHHLDHVLAAH